MVNPIPRRTSFPGAGPLETELARRDGEIARSINFVGWRDLVGGITIKGTPDANSPTWAEITGMTGMFAYKFDAATMNQVWIVFHVDHDYALNTPIYLHTHWINAAATPNTGNVRWGFEYSAAKGHQQQAFPATTTVYSTQASSSTRYMHHIAEVSTTDAVPSTNLEPDSLIMVRIFRDAANGGDSCTDAVYLLLADCHYQADRTSTQNKSPSPSFYK